MSKSDLSKFGVSPPSVVRKAVSGKHECNVCAECGRVVGGRPTCVRIQKPTIPDDEVAEAIGDELVTHGWVCERHSYRVIHPVPTGADGSGVGPGWTGIRVEFADGMYRYVATPEREVSGE